MQSFDDVRVLHAPRYMHTPGFFGQFDDLLRDLGLCRADSGDAHTVVQRAPHLPSVHKLSTYAGLSMLAAAHAAVALGRCRGQKAQALFLDLSDAQRALNPERLFAPRLNAKPYANAGIADNPYLRAPYRTQDNRYIMLSALYAPMAQKLNAFLDCAPTPAGVAQAVALWNGVALEEALAKEAIAATLCRTPEQWRQHPQAKALSICPVAGYRRVGDGAARLRPKAKRPLEGFRVLSFGRALAGPIVGRTLAEQGADVLGISYPGYIEHEAVWCEANVGHRNACLDVRKPCDREVIESLLCTADVVIDNHQSPRLAALGLDAASISKRHPGTVHIGISAFGHTGPWANRSGFDMNASAATGIMYREGAGKTPRLPVCHLMHDVVAGYLGAASVTAALRAQALDGGSYAIHLSLARCAMWCQDLGYLDEAARAEAVLDTNAPHSLRLVAQTPLGTLERMAPCVQYARTPSVWQTPILVAQGSSKAQWLPRTQS